MSATAGVTGLWLFFLLCRCSMILALMLYSRLIRVTMPACLLMVRPDRAKHTQWWVHRSAASDDIGSSCRASISSLADYLFSFVCLFFFQSYLAMVYNLKTNGFSQTPWGVDGLITFLQLCGMGTFCQHDLYTFFKPIPPALRQYTCTGFSFQTKTFFFHVFYPKSSSFSYLFCHSSFKHHPR